MNMKQNTPGSNEKKPWSKKKKIIIGIICFFVIISLIPKPKVKIPNVVGMDVNAATKKLEKKEFSNYTVVNTKGNSIDSSDYNKYVVKVESPTGEASTSTTIKLTVKKSAEQLAKEKAAKEAKLAQQKAALEEAQRRANPDAYKPSCQAVTYDDLYRNPSSYMGKDVTLRGKIMQVVTSDNTTVYLVQVTQDEYGLWDDIVMVADSRADKSNNFIEDDIIQLYGTSAGNTSYETAMGSSKNVPLISALYIDMTN